MVLWFMVVGVCFLGSVVLYFLVLGDYGFLVDGLIVLRLMVFAFSLWF